MAVHFAKEVPTSAVIPFLALALCPLSVEVRSTDWPAVVVLETVDSLAFVEAELAWVPQQEVSCAVDQLEVSNRLHGPGCHFAESDGMSCPVPAQRADELSLCLCCLAAAQPGLPLSAQPAVLVDASRLA